MKFDIAINGERLDNWANCEITLDQAYNSSAQFSIHSPGDSGWLTNLSKVLISGRHLNAETSLYGFENPSDLIPWRWSTGLANNGLDYTRSAFGAGCWSLDWADAQVVRVYQTPTPANMYGLNFSGWFQLDYLTTFVPQVGLEAYANDGVNEWASPRIILSNANGWQAQGLRLVPTSLVPYYPSAILEWGFRLSFSGTVPPAFAGLPLFRLGVDSINICGRTYAEAFSLPPFATDAVPQGVLAPAQSFPCEKWDAFDWANELHITTNDPGWCVSGITWDHFTWADALFPKPTDAEWG